MIEIEHHRVWFWCNCCLAFFCVAFLLPHLFLIVFLVLLPLVFFKKQHDREYIACIQGKPVTWSVCWHGVVYERLVLVDSICLFNRVVFLRFSTPYRRRGLSMAVIFKRARLGHLRQLQRLVFNGTSKPSIEG